MRYLQVYGPSNFRLGIPDDARTTFAPWAPPQHNENGDRAWRNPNWANGTLRVYQGAGEKNCLGVFSPVYGFRDETLQYEPEVRVAEPRVHHVDMLGEPLAGMAVAQEARWWDEEDRIARAFPMEPEPVELPDDFNR